MLEKRCVSVVVLCMVLMALPPVAGGSQYIPESFTFSDNYYTVYGGPQIDAVLAGDNEFERGEDVQLKIDVYNHGKVLGFKSEKTPTTAEQIARAELEKNYELQVTTAIGVVCTLKNPYGAPVTINSGSQSAGSLRAGEKTQAPLSFSVEIDDDAPAGEYTLVLESTFSYQKNVQVSGDPRAGTEEVSFWYDTMTQRSNITFFVKKEPRFEVVSVSGDLHPGDKSTLTVVYKNVGEEPAREATARLSLVDPFSSTDDQAYLGTLNPNESATATFKINVDADALPKLYGLNSEIKYKDEHGDIKISDVVKVPVEVHPVQRTLGVLPALGAVALVIIGGVLWYRRRRAT
ncbi:COG1361 S-layer family protein [Methermicoccus shengliensis]|uniref:Uncharacterized protein n=1 Tax=Methermicoccus shengliensis TaxID=660064 RepID=A0A832RX17_9EURY|nr:hypothetical protein [Methermicoccus shengliensis]KUK04017.1 MAG: Uncharacterized protein XD46_1257 [Euryarchaeota archaeon 55_53]KUK29750.1 MAG: Uncharacterized protein XD62_1173 [Methanosarcinales archeaon 56_1174]MDI3488546.1 hypothetical protein [Methanosarcinales archaeon]MDN5295867.1 hypothetical protein [Methanosarcinales archaeon]HIH69941.1 hypothetical protein [Methermicoccus shengliensis]